ncbi:hypothetical protein JOB18_023179 [Solea senegalensis]|uniref:Serine-rich coiled-coil domain-containing protein 2-like n=1 Tax=Solea senegalensis TaxID=28829 RepID=A0AAV6RNT4_SOLSE|nr:serine-rich coiled-coil domain-containing protein 2-like isoform X2 [Solea senegalensis]KAG7507061.1 hypothetical protein JOB18_023179 [Solea senegalensis]KAG7507068.1 hypothetical protein JOB18_023179 [Solea senegalensis]
MSLPPPCLVDSSSVPTMVSRLPKFGSRSKSTSVSNSVQTDTSSTGTFTGAAGTRLTNGFYHHPGPAGGTGPTSSLKQNGFLRAPTSFSMKWRKDDGTPPQEGGANAEGEWRRGKRGSGFQNRSGNNIHYDSSQRQQESKKTATASEVKGRGFVQTATPSSWPSAQSSSRTLPISKPGSEVSKPSQTASRLKSGFPGSRPRSGTTGSLRQPQTFPRTGGYRQGPGPCSRAGSPFQKKVPASRSHSSDGLGSTQTALLSQSNRFRSQSLTQVRQQAPPIPTPSSLLPSPTIPRASFTSRAAERATAQAPPTGGRKSPVTRQSPEGGIRGGGAPPPSVFKKPLLPNLGPASRPSGISYKLTRPSLFKQARPLRVTPPSGTEVKVKSVEFKSTAENCSENPPETLEGLSTVSQAEVSMVGETLEDMSMSSTSSLDRNDISQEEYMDDFDNLGNGGVGILLLSKNDEDDSGLDQSCARFDDGGVNVNSVAVATALCFLEDGMDWASMKLSGDGARRHMTPLSRHRRSSHHDDHEQDGSSLDLSPSDSCASDGTYMWDEEGLEPLGGAITSTSINTKSSNNTLQHSRGSFDSDVHSIDVLNDLDNLDSCDLEDDDLMLDADLAEDLSLHSDGDGLSHMAEWRRRQLCWGTQDVHNDNDSDFACYELTEDPGNKRTDVDGDVVLDLCPSRTALLSVVTPPAGVGVDMEDLAEECSAVRSQLKYLQMLLLQDEDGDTVSPDVNNSSQSSDSQVQLLLQEVQQLREELKSRDRTIAHLLQMSVPTVTARCRCQETTGRTDQHTQTSVIEREGVASQTPRREESQIFDSSHQNDQEPLMDQVSTPPPPAQAPPPSYPHSDAATDSTPEDREDDGYRAVKETGGGGGACSRSVRLPQPSKLRLLPPHTSTTAPPLKTNTYRQIECGVTSGGHLRTSLPRLCPTSRRQRQTDGDSV